MWHRRSVSGAGELWQSTLPWNVEWVGDSRLDGLRVRDSVMGIYVHVCVGLYCYEMLGKWRYSVMIRIVTVG